MGCRKIVAGLALVAPLLLLNQPKHAMAAPSRETPLAACSLAKIAYRSDDGYTGDGEMPDPREADRQACAAGADTGVSTPDRTIYFTPILQDHDDLEDDTTIPVRHLKHAPVPKLPAI
jgi:hypothetical protein